MLSHSIPDTSSSFPTVTSRTFSRFLPDDRNATLRLAAELRSQLDEQYRPDGFNLDANVDKAGGQTVGHAHLHVIPRNWGDVSDPRGGIRCLIPERSR